jgi:hypothetical protein
MEINFPSTGVGFGPGPRDNVKEQSFDEGLIKKISHCFSFHVQLHSPAEFETGESISKRFRQLSGP